MNNELIIKKKNKQKRMALFLMVFLFGFEYSIKNCVEPIRKFISCKLTQFQFRLSHIGMRVAQHIDRFERRTRIGACGWPLTARTSAPLLLATHQTPGWGQDETLALARRMGRAPHFESPLAIVNLIAVDEFLFQLIFFLSFLSLFESILNLKKGTYNL